jgi:hypothetical protein
VGKKPFNSSCIVPVDKTGITEVIEADLLHAGHAQASLAIPLTILGVFMCLAHAFSAPNHYSYGSERG